MWLPHSPESSKNMETAKGLLLVGQLSYINSENSCALHKGASSESFEVELKPSF